MSELYLLYLYIFSLEIYLSAPLPLPFTLQIPDSYPGISKLKEIVAAHSHLMEEARTINDKTHLEPFIVVEGMDATGK